MAADDLVILALMAGLAVAIVLYVRWRRRQEEDKWWQFILDLRKDEKSDTQNVPSTDTPGRSGA